MILTLFLGDSQREPRHQAENATALRSDQPTMSYPTNLRGQTLRSDQFDNIVFHKPTWLNPKLRPTRQQFSTNLLGQTLRSDQLDDVVFYQFIWLNPKVGPTR